MIGLLHEANFTGHYNRNPFNFQAFNLNRIDVYRSGTKCPQGGYTPDFTQAIYFLAYNTFTKELGLNRGNEAVAFTPTEWSNGYFLYVFKVTDGPIGSGAVSPRSPIPTGDIKISVGFAAVNNNKYQSRSTFSICWIYAIRPI